MRQLGARVLTALPASQWLPAWRTLVRRDAIAALAVWAVLVPQSMAYASLAGVPAANGLYAAFAGLLVYALLGTSGQLNVGPSSGIALLSASTVAPIAAGNPKSYLALSAALAITTGAMLLAGGLLRLGFVAEFLARPVLAGYFIGLALTIVVGQLPALLGLPSDPSSFFTRCANLIRDIPDIDGWTVVVGVGTLSFLLVLRQVAPKAPGALIAVVTGIIAGRSLDLATHGVALLGSIDATLPEVGLPDIPANRLGLLIGGAAGIALLAYAESIAAARRFAAEHGYEVDANRELVAMGASNIGAGLVQGFPIDASVSRTVVGDGAGQRSQLAGLLNAVLVLLTVLLLTSFFGDLPRATLAAIVIAAVLPLLRTGELRRLQRLDDVDFALAATCLFGVLLFGVLGGIVVAVGVSLLALVHRSFRPNLAVLGRLATDTGSDEDFAYRDLRRHPEGRTYPGLVIFRFDQEIFFANANLFRDNVRRLALQKDVRMLLIDATAVTHIDTTGLDTIDELQRELADHDVELAFARLKGPVRDTLRRAASVQAAEPFTEFSSIDAGVAAFLAHDPSDGRTPDAPPSVRG